MKEDPIATHARELKRELQRDGFNCSPNINWLDELMVTYTPSPPSPESRLKDLEQRMDALEKIFGAHCRLEHKL